jgi:hypothetical protein
VSQRVCAKSLEVVAGRSTRMASAFIWGSSRTQIIRERNDSWQVLKIAKAVSARLS